MIETLLKRSAVLARYQEAPYAVDRDAFLTSCAQAGYSNAMLKKIAWGLPAVADSIDLSVQISTQDIELAVDRRTHFTRQGTDPQANGSPDTRQLLVRFATQWVRSMGALRSPEGEYSPFTAQCEVFARYLREERGLSSVTIATRRERLVWFFRELNPSRQALCDIVISDIDAFLEAKGKQGWTRASLSALAGSLRSFFTFAEARGWCAPGLAAVIESPRLYAREGLPEGPDWNDVQRLLASCSEEISSYPPSTAITRAIRQLSAGSHRHPHGQKLPLDPTLSSGGSGRYPVTDWGDAGRAEVLESGRRAPMLCGRLHAGSGHSRTAFEHNRPSRCVQIRSSEAQAGFKRKAVSPSCPGR